jgi:hypothetical protein
MGEAPELHYVNSFSKFGHDDQIEQHLANNYDHDFSWYEEVIDDDLKWSFALNRFTISFTINTHIDFINNNDTLIIIAFIMIS